MRLNQLTGSSDRLNDDSLYRPWREFWGRADVERAVTAACRNTREWLCSNESKFQRDQIEGSNEFYSQVLVPWFPKSESLDAGEAYRVRWKLRRSRMEDRVREQGLIDLFYRQLPAALRDIPGTEQARQLQWDAKDWSELLNACAWSILDEVLGAYEAPKANNHVPFTHLKRVYGYSLKAPVTHLAGKIALRFSRAGLLRMSYQDNQYFAASGPVYRVFYREVYEPVTAIFENRL